MVFAELPGGIAERLQQVGDDSSFFIAAAGRTP